MREKSLRHLFLRENENANDYDDDAVAHLSLCLDLDLSVHRDFFLYARSSRFSHLCQSCLLHVQSGSSISI